MRRYIGAIAIGISVVLVTLLTIFKDTPEESLRPQALMQVPVVVTNPKPVFDTIEGFGFARARWQSNIPSEVSGRVVSVSEKFLSGKAVTKGEVLVTIEDTGYAAALVDAKATAAVAKRTQREEEQRSAIASKNWKASGLAGSPNDLVRRLPQLAEAAASIKAATAAISKAEYDLEATRIRAPYDGVIIARNINPGEFLQVGSAIGSIYDNTLFEIVVQLATDKVTRLPDEQQFISAGVFSQKGDYQWKGQISRVEKMIDAQNRWQNVVVEVPDPKGLLPGAFTRVEFTGKRHSAVLAIPENLPANDGYVWFVDAQNRLQRFMPNEIFRRNGMVYLQAPSLAGFVPRLAYAQDIFLPDIEVEPIPASAETQHARGSL